VLMMEELVSIILEIGILDCMVLMLYRVVVVAILNFLLFACGSKENPREVQ
jgi:hypothetical protein